MLRDDVERDAGAEEYPSTSGFAHLQLGYTGDKQGRESAPEHLVRIAVLLDIIPVVVGLLEIFVLYCLGGKPGWYY